MPRNSRIVGVDSPLTGPSWVMTTGEPAIALRTGLIANRQAATTPSVQGARLVALAFCCKTIGFSSPVKCFLDQHDGRSRGRIYTPGASWLSCMKLWVEKPPLRNAWIAAGSDYRRALSVFARQPSALLRQALDIERLLRRDVAQIARRRAGPELAFGHALARRHHRACRDPGAALDHRAVHDAGLHADEARILERAGMDQRHVADGDMGADAHPFLEHARDVHDRAVLDVGVGADADRRDIAAQHAAEPDVGIGGDLGVANDDRRLCHPRLRRDARQRVAEGQDEAAAHGNKGSCSSPVVSAMPSMTFISCTACPEAPFTRLSIAETRMARPDRRSCAKPIWHKFEPRT